MAEVAIGQRRRKEEAGGDKDRAEGTNSRAEGTNSSMATSRGRGDGGAEDPPSLFPTTLTPQPLVREAATWVATFEVGPL